MITIQALGLDDIIEPHDLVRDLHYSSREYDKRVSMWTEAEVALPAWVGKTLKDFYSFRNPKYDPEDQRSHQILRVPPSQRQEGGFRVNKRMEISLFP